MWCSLLLVIVLTMGPVLLGTGAQVPGPGPGLTRKRSPMITETTNTFAAGYSTQMQSRAVDTRVTLDVAEGQPRGTTVGHIPRKSGFTYRFNEPPREFALDAATGEITTNVVLDREALRNDRYDLVVLSSQPTYPIEVRIIVTDVNDNPPEFPEASIAVSFSESAATGTRLLLDAATDRDAGKNGVSEDYRIIAGNKDDKFKLGVTPNPTGETAYLHLEITGKLDRESQGFYTLNISARDDGIPPKHGYLQVNVTVLDVNDNPPIFDHSDYIVSLNESVPPGTPVLQVMATDNDLGDNSKITYYLADTERQFTVDPETGIISTTEHLECPQQQSCSQTVATPSGNCPKSCVFTVFARDHGSPRQDGRTYVTVNLVDANDHDPIIRFQYFPPTAAFATVDENAGNGTVVAAVSVVDVDEGPNGETTVRIVSGNELNHFRLEYTTSFDLVRVLGVLDREEISKYNLTVVATDKGNPPRTATAFLIIHVNDVNDHEPVFAKSEYSAVLSELAPPGTYVAGITATDEDSGVNAQIYYAFVSGNKQEWFDIDSESGLITTKAILNREIQGTVELNISARDGGPNPKWAHTQLKVTILDENDEAPEFSQASINVSLSESSPPNTLVAMLTAADHDQGTNGSVTYILHPTVEQKYPKIFALDSLTGQLTTRSKIDREAQSFYEIQVIARDQGIPSQSSTATVNLNVLDVNDNSPIFYPQIYFVAVPDDVKIGASLLKVTATDLDEGDNAIIRYKLESGGEGLFSVDEWSGVVTLKGNFIATQHIYNINISARDHGNKRAVGDAVLEIIKEVYMEHLSFDSYGYEFQIVEDYGANGTNSHREVGSVRVKTSETVTYSIVYGDPRHCFTIDEHTGIIRTAGNIDREQTIIYTLSVIARVGLSYGKTSVTIAVLDLNDNKPVFLRDKDEVKLLENTAVGQEVYLARARDLDAGINSKIIYTLNYNPEDQFRISETTGVVYLNRPILAEPNSVLQVEITAADRGEPELSSKYTIIFTVEDVNDHTPVFDHTSYETSLVESTQVNERFFALSASDADCGINSRVVYTISEGNMEKKFGVFPDGFLYVRSPLDREDKDYYSLTVTVSDLGSPARSSIVPVVINVIDENDNAPEFTNSTFTFSIRENEPPDTFVGKLTATDKDIGRNAELLYSLQTSQSDFVIDPKNGFIKTATAFDREELVQRTGQNFIMLEAAVTDNGKPRLRDKVKVKVYVTDVNDNAPKFLRVPYKVQITEGASVGTQVLRLYTTDADEGLNGDVFYSIAAGNDERRFDIDDATGQIVVVRSLDRETTAKYILTVIAHDAALNNKLHSQTNVVIDVLDENDNAPEFTQTNSKISVVETTPVSTEIMQFHVTDADLGLNADVTFSITLGNRRDTFHIDAITGVLSLHKSLDYEDLSSYQLNITASDNGNPRLSTTILFAIAVQDANDNPPAFPNTAIVRQIREGIPIHTPIVTATAEDPDSGVNGKVTYSISYQEPDDPKRHFGINPLTGVIHTLLPIDRERIDTFRLTVLATDQAENLLGRLSAEKLVTVIVEDINDNAPVFVSMNSALLPMDSTQPGRDGTLVMNIVAKDLDSSTNGLVTYELVSGNSDLFKLHRSTGALTLKRPLSLPETRYKLALKATDEAVQSERKSTEAYITIIAPGNHKGAPMFDSQPFAGSVYENEPAGTSILRVRARSAIGAAAEIEYYVTNVTGNGLQVDRLFDIDTKLGVLSTATELDREAGVDIYEIEVFAIVVGGGAKTSKTKVHVTVLDKNDSPPAFRDAPLQFSVSEDLAAGLAVATLRAVDPDTLGTVHYRLLPGTGANTNDSRHFALEADTGVLRLAESLDREQKDVYRLLVRASDGIQETDTTVIVQVTDTNDNPPAFLEAAYSFDIPENAVRGARIGQIRAVDPDLGTNAQLTYTVISDWANDVFSLNPQTGVFTLTSRLDYEEVQHYILVVQAQDSGTPSLSSTLTIYCNVVDLNDNAPIFDPMSYSNEIYENVSMGTNVLTVSATDLDSGNNGKIEYSITSGDSNGDFTITSNGSVLTNKQLDRESIATYNLIITATDQAEDAEKRLSTTVQATILLKDVNDMSPEFISPNDTTIAENVPLNTVVMAVKTVDKDEGRNGYIEYYLSALTEDDIEVRQVFSLGPVDGLLRVAGQIDRETRASYVLLVTARDRGDPPRSSQAQLHVRVLDRNDNSPVFDPRQYSAAVAENASIGASVLQVSATDVDEGLNGRVRYSIVDGDTNRDFTIAEDTGIVRVAKNLNYERKSRYLLNVRAEDCSDQEPRTDTAEIAIAVQDINDNPPTFLDSPYLAYVMENVTPPGGGYVLTVRAYDADTPPFNSLVRYFIKEGDTDLFRINASSGEISLLRALDRELQAEYTLSLVAMDTGSPPLTGSGSVKIIVQDVNDHSPEFKRQSYRAMISENSPSGTWILTALATDKDSGLNARIKYSLLGDKMDRFHVDQDTGVITTKVLLDREDVDIYRLTLMAQDCSSTEPRAAAVNLTITVLDENDNSPTFSNGKYEVYISDNTKSGQFVFGAKAVDNDIGKNSKIIYRISGEHALNFSINSETGVIKAVYDLFKQAVNFYHIEITAEDGGIPPRVTSTQLKIFLKPSHLFPTFTGPSVTQFTLAENVEENKLITVLRAVSPKKDSLGKIRYAVAGGNIGDALKVDKVTGDVQIAGKGLDYEAANQYDVWVESMDSDDPPLRTALQLVINVTDANDNAPVINTALYNATIMEEESPPLLVVKIQATDVDSGENGLVQYRIVDDFDGTFEIDSDSGEIYTNVKLDREDIPNYELIVEAVDQGTPTLSGSATVLVNVLDKNDNPPRFTRLFSVNVTENADINSFVIRVTSSDQDIGENANATYSFTENPGGKFKIDPISGNVTVVGPLDREQQDEYLLKVAAVDGAWRAETPLTITIQDQNDNAPEFEHSYYSFNFPELQRDIVFVGQVTATDRDKQGPNSVISYSLQQPSDLFTCDPASGEIFSKKSLKYKYTQLESSPENMFSLTILATDNGKPPMSSECLLTVNIVDSNNNAPKFEEKEYLSPVPEDAIEDQRLLRVTAKDDLDFGLNAEVQYTIVGGNGSEYFTIDGNSGWISLTSKLRIVGQVYNLKVRAVDKGVPPQQDEAKVTLITTGENRFNPVFTALSYQVIVPENEPVGSTILTVSATDADDGPNGMLRYEISAGNERKEFAIDTIKGAIIILQPLDYDTVQEYKLNITAMDLGFKPRHATSTLTITLTDINDNAPTFNQNSYKAYIAENLPTNSLIYRVKATDADSPKNAIILYSIINGSGKDVMAINSKTGDVTAKISFDFEENNRYTLKIRASNPDSTMFGTTELIIYVTGVNEYYPRFLHSVFHFDVSESTDIGTSIGTIHATDQDAGDDGKVYYLLVGSSNDKGFSINPDTGIIRVSRSLDRETQSRVILTVMAKNAGGIRGNDTDEAQVIISIQDGNDPPEFLQKVYEANISEGASVGTKVVTVKAIDKDVRPQNNQFSYSIIEGNTNISFKIDPQIGEIEIISPLDRETVPMYTLTVAAIDTGLPPQTGIALVKIHVSDINDNGPIFDPKPIGKILENEPANTKIITLSAKDPDLPPNGAPFSYKLIGGKQRDFVTIDRHAGTIYTTKIIDREVTPELELIVEVEDSGSPKLHSQHTIKIEVIDQNDSPSTSRSVHVLVHSFADLYPLGKIADVHPNDADISGDYRCRIMQGPTVAGLLTIPSGCNLYTTRITPDQGYSLSVLGNDGKHSDVISTVTVEFLSFDNKTIDNSITLQIANITAQQFLSSKYRGLVDILKSTISSSETLSIFCLQEVEKNLHITVAVRSGKSYKMKSYITERFLKKQSAINQLVMRTVSINYSPCNENTCENNGICSEAINVKSTTKITDSQNIIFTSPEISHDYSCHCTDGFTGTNCQKKQDPCSPNPCKSGAQCRRQGYNFQCICPANKDGKYCELERGDVCLENPCQNGGSCRENPDGSSYFCLCRPGYRGNQCEALVDSCRPNPCLHGGLCVSMKPGYKCSCTDGRYGQHCEKSTFSFKELSYMVFPPLDAATNDISFIFATTKADSLLVYNYGLQTGGRSDFVAIELVNGKAVFSFGGARTAITSIKVAGKENNLANGKWHKITATRNGRVVSLSVSSCVDQGDTCEDCKPGDMSCYADDIGPAGTLNFNNQPLLIGGLNTADPILERPGQVHSDDLVGCVHSVSINGRQLNLTNPIQAYGVGHSCSSRGSCQQTSEDPCVDSRQCIDRWHTLSCNCGDNLIAPNCRSALQPISMSDGGYIEFTISKKHRRMQLLEAFYGGSTLWKHHRQIRSIVKETPPYDLTKSVSFVFRTVRDNGVLFYSTSNKHLTALELRDGQLHYISKLATVINMTDSHHAVTDGQWHKILLFSQAGGLKIMLDDVQIGDELDTVGVHDFLDAYLTSLSLGGVRATLYYSEHVAPQFFEGCIANFTVNNEIQPFNGSGSIFDEVTIRGHVIRDCNGPVGLGAVAAPDPLSIGITLVIVFFVVLLIAILVSFVVFRLRKQSKEKDGVAPGGSSPSIKQQNGGNHTILASNGLVVSSVNDNVLSRSLHSNDTSLGYHSENGDVIRGISGHPLVGPELLSKKFKEQRDILQGELPRPQRPDIIEREVLTKSPPMRSMDDAHHPPLPPTSNHMHHDHSTDMNSEIPEHYDLENASSIAPSDIDIVYHYKGYREAAAAAAAAAAAGGGVRKYKATPPPVGYHHKHTSAAQGQSVHQQHRHSPHHPSVAACYPPPRAPGVGGPGGGGVGGGGGGSGGRQPPTHQSTPLARLSPSSEMSAQQPRILTLHDISGKPLQSALLATTTSSSGGGVGKDVLHSNSERSLNSPVMSQLSGQSSNNNRKVNSAPIPSAPSPAGIGLTADEIERLNSRPRNSSLVSTLDAVSSSSEVVPRGNVMNHHLVHQHQHTAPPPVPPPDHAAHHRSAPPTAAPTGSASTGTTSTDESGNDSFTCSEIEYDNASLNGPDDDDDDDKYKPSVVGGTPDAPPLPRHHNNNSSNSTLSVTGNSIKNNGLLSPAVSYHDGFDSSYRGSMSTLVASDDEIGGPLYHHSHHHRSSSHDGGSSPPSGVATAAAAAALGWDYLLNWGPNFESLAGVFKDIAELPDTVPTVANGNAGNGGAGSRLPAGLRLTNAPKPSEEYV